ncbi:Fungalysin metallopeptidase-domain-containing protein [Syncephalis plumigaleata]|nr:Fungalysin metallopeptidase-domain-containing protein [Syncephalis plumigaleata]KAI8048781.1 Fungalysin metallopeptidase-domain-containing protein [Syncephalis plumigaleata]
MHLKTIIILLGAINALNVAAQNSRGVTPIVTAPTAGKPLAATNLPLSPIIKASLVIKKIEPLSITPVAAFATIANSTKLAEASAAFKTLANPGAVAQNFVVKYLEVTEAIPETNYVSALTGTTHIYFKQHIGGIEVTNGDIGVTVTKEKNIVAYSDVSFKADPKNPVNVPYKAKLAPWPQFTPQQLQATQLALISTVAQRLGLPVSPPPANLAIEPQRRADKSASFVIKNVPYAAKPIVTRQVYIINEERNAIPAWRIDVQVGPHPFTIHVTTDGKAVLALADGLSSASYSAVPLGYSDVKSSGALLPIPNPHDPRVSPNGWHSINGRTTQETEGSNALVVIVTDLAQGKTASVSHPNNDYIYQFDPRKSVKDNERAAVSNAFYLVNTMHDINANYGFTSDAGNFESGTGTYPDGTPKNDRIMVTLQDPRSPDNAMFGTAPYGQPSQLLVGLTPGPNVQDFAFDNDIMIHEITHGTTDRLVGGYENDQCLRQKVGVGMSEGYSDFVALWVRFAKAAETNQVDLHFGTYTNSNIRKYPFSPDKKKNPLTANALNGLTYPEVHDMGNLWGNMLYQVYLNLKKKLPVTTEFRTRQLDKSNTLVMAMLMESLTSLPCNPTFVDGRDALLLAEQTLTKGAYNCEVYAAFAKYGLGEGAGQPKLLGRITVSDKLPAACATRTDLMV